MCSDNKSYVIYSCQEAMYHGGEEHPLSSVVGDISKKGQIDYSRLQQKAHLPNQFYVAESCATNNEPLKQIT